MQVRLPWITGLSHHCSSWLILQLSLAHSLQAPMLWLNEEVVPLPAYMPRQLPLIAVSLGLRSSVS